MSPQSRDVLTCPAQDNGGLGHKCTPQVPGFCSNICLVKKASTSSNHSGMLVCNTEKEYTVLCTAGEINFTPCSVLSLLCSFCSAVSVPSVTFDVSFFSLHLLRG